MNPPRPQNTAALMAVSSPSYHKVSPCRLQATPHFSRWALEEISAPLLIAPCISHPSDLAVGWVSPMHIQNLEAKAAVNVV